MVGLSSLLQSITAISLILGFYYILSATRAEAEQWASILETASFVMVATIGGYLMLQGLRTLKQALRSRRQSPDKNATHTAHGSHCGCGHAHAPTPEALAQSPSFAALTAMIISIGIRPCTGALLLLFFSCMFDLVWPGVLATLAMGLDTATSTSALAIVAVTSKKLALSFVAKSDRGLLFATHLPKEWLGQS